MSDTRKGFSIFPTVVIDAKGPNFGLHLPYARTMNTNFEDPLLAKVVLAEIGSPPKLSVGSLVVSRMPASKSSRRDHTKARAEAEARVLLF